MISNRNVPEEQKGAETDHLLANLIETSPTSIIVYDFDGNILYANQKALDFHGYTREVFLKFKLQDLIVPESRILIRPRIEEIKRRGELSFEVQHFQKDHTRIPLLVNANIGKWGRKEVFLTTLTDITRQKRAEVAKDTKLVEETTERARVENELRASEEKFHSLLRNILDVLWTSDENGNTPYISEGVTKVFGFTPEEIVNTPNLWFSRVHPDDIDRVKAVYQELIKHGKLYDIEFRLQRKDGAWIWVHDRAAKVYTKDGIRYVDGMFRDITARKRGEAALQQNEAYYRSLFENSLYGIGVTGPDLKFQQVNNALCKLLEYDPGELVGKKDIIEVTHPEDKDTCKELLGKLVRKELDHFIVEKRYVARTGRIINALNFCQGIYDGTGRYIGASASILDITDRKLAEEELRKHRDHLEELVKERTSELEMKNTKLAEENTERNRVEGALQESEKMFRTLAESSPNMIFINQGGRIVYVNRRCVEMMGYSQDEFYDPHFDFMTLIAHEYWESMRTMFRRHAAGEEVSSKEYALLTKDGRRIEARYDSRLIPYQGKSAILGVITDITEYKRAEESLRESEARLKEAQKLGKIGSYEYDLVTNTYTWSDQTYRIFNRDPAQGTPITWEEIFSYYNKDQIPPFKECYRLAVEEGKSSQIDLDATLPSGSPAFISATIQPIKDNNGRIVKIFGTLQDITERKRAEEALRESEARLKDAQILGRIGSWEFDINTQKIIWSDETFRLYDRDPALGPPTTEEDASFYSREQEQHLGEYYRLAMMEGKSYKFDLEARLPSGRQVFFLATLQPIKDAGGRVIKLFGTVQDITERKRAEDALLASEAKYRSIVDAAPWGMHFYELTSDRRLLFLGANPAADQILGVDHNQFIGKTIEEAFPPLAKTEVPEKYRRVADTGQSWYTEQINYEDQKIRGAFEVHAFQMAPRQMVAAFLDITVRKKIEQERKALLEKTLQISDLKSDLITQAAHELKTPLTSILGWGGMLYTAKQKGDNLDATFDIEDIETIVRNAERLNDIINDFLDVGRIDRGKFVITKESIDFSEIIENATRAVNYLAIQKNIKISTELASTNAVQVDRRRMEQVIINLLSNAIKYSLERTCVKIITSPVAVGGRKMLQVMVIDQGYGFTPEELAEATTLFGKIYTQQDQKKGIKGTGIGLFISSRIVEQHGGTLVIRSEGPNKGTRVEILLPLG